jgi:hypothetical protein
MPRYIDIMLVTITTEVLSRISCMSMDVVFKELNSRV